MQLHSGVSKCYLERKKPSTEKYLLNGLICLKSKNKTDLLCWKSERQLALGEASGRYEEGKVSVPEKSSEDGEPPVHRRAKKERMAYLSIKSLLNILFSFMIKLQKVSSTYFCFSSMTVLMSMVNYLP